MAKKLSLSEKQRITKRRKAKQTFWRRGFLRWKLHELQEKIYDAYWDDNRDITTMLIARQTGKSFVLAILAIEVCLRQENAVVKFVTPKLKQVKNILNKNMKVILKDCPVDVRPEWKENEKVWRFPNGSEIQAAGTDNQNYDSIRGGTCHAWMVDEAGFCSDLEEVVYNVLIPTTTMTGGRGLLSSTPDPKKPEHEFIRIFVDKAIQDGELHKYTIDDNPRLSDEAKQRIENMYPGGRKNPSFRAEYMCEIIRDSDSMVIPEFDDEAEAEIVCEHERPGFFDSYLAMDIGGKDFTVILLGYYDFGRDMVVIEDEVVLKEKQNSEQIAISVKKKMEELWGEKPPYLMFADNNNIILLNDLQIYHGLNFLPTKKDNKEAQINQVRLKIQGRKLSINPRCKTLIYHLKTATWAKTGSNRYRQFARSADQGHFDAIDALVYFIRNVIYGKNPFPSGYGDSSPADSYARPEAKKEYSDIFKLFKVRKSLKR